MSRPNDKMEIISASYTDGLLFIKTDNHEDAEALSSRLEDLGVISRGGRPKSPGPHGYPPSDGILLTPENVNHLLFISGYALLPESKRTEAYKAQLICQFLNLNRPQFRPPVFDEPKLQDVTWGNWRALRDIYSAKCHTADDFDVLISKAEQLIQQVYASVGGEAGLKDLEEHVIKNMLGSPAEITAIVNLKILVKNLEDKKAELPVRPGSAPDLAAAAAAAPAGVAGIPPEAPMPKVHVFIGAGPANLDRALKIKHLDPDAKLIFIDDRVNPDGTIDRDRSRANIFRFTLDVRQQLIDSGISPAEFEAVEIQREFGEDKGFQKGDEHVFGTGRYTQIQIRDLQNLYLKALKRGGNSPVFIKTKKLEWLSKIDARPDGADLLKTNLAELVPELADANQEMMVHIATGAVTEDDPHAKFHHAALTRKDLHLSVGPSPDTDRLAFTPVHGTATFPLKNPDGSYIIDPKSLVDKTVSLDNTNWQEKLAQHGWSVLRPPRVRVFYADDTLYLGVEVPADWEALATSEDPAIRLQYQQKLADFTKEIAQLVLPEHAEQVSHLQANMSGVNAPSFFKTRRGENNKTISLSSDGKVVAINHGDRRYLPHYQTGSGFVTAVEQNKAYAEIYSKSNFDDLARWAQENELTDGGRTEHEAAQKRQDLFKSYCTRHGIDPINVTPEQKTKVLRIYQADLYVIKVDKILHENKQKVGKYFTEIERQAIGFQCDNINFSDLIDKFKFYHQDSKDPAVVELLKLNFSLSPEARPVAVMEMLNHGNPTFLMDILPNLTNVSRADIQRVGTSDPARLKAVRERFTNNYHELLDNVEIKALVQNTPNKLELIKQIQGFQAKLNADAGPAPAKVDLGSLKQLDYQGLNNLKGLKDFSTEDLKQLLESFHKASNDIAQAGAEGGDRIDPELFKARKFSPEERALFLRRGADLPGAAAAAAAGAPSGGDRIDSELLKARLFSPEERALFVGREAPLPELAVEGVSPPRSNKLLDKFAPTHRLVNRDPARAEVFVYSSSLSAASVSRDHRVLGNGTQVLKTGKWSCQGGVNQMIETTNPAIRDQWAAAGARVYAEVITVGGEAGWVADANTQRLPGIDLRPPMGR